MNFGDVSYLSSPALSREILHPIEEETVSDAEKEETCKLEFVKLDCILDNADCSVFSTSEVASAGITQTSRDGAGMAEHSDEMESSDFKLSSRSSSKVKRIFSDDNDFLSENHQKAVFLTQRRSIKHYISAAVKKETKKALSPLFREIKQQAENSNEQIALLMKGLMDSYDLINDRVSDLGAALSRILDQKSEKHQSICKLKSDTPQTTKPHKRDVRHKEAGLRDAVRVLEEKLNNFKSALAKDISLCGHDEGSILRQISSLAKHLAAIESSLTSVEIERTKIKTKSAAMESKINQIYDECRLTLKTVDFRYRSLKKIHKKIKQK